MPLGVSVQNEEALRKLHVPQDVQCLNFLQWRGYPAGLPGGGGPGAAQKRGWGCRKSTGGQTVLLGWSRGCAEAMEGGEAEKGHGTSGGTLTMVARGRIIRSVGFYYYY